MPSARLASGAATAKAAERKARTRSLWVPVHPGWTEPQGNGAARARTRSREKEIRFERLATKASEAFLRSDASLGGGIRGG